MPYDEFLEALKDRHWVVTSRSFAYRDLEGGWQVVFDRMGGKFQVPGKVSFVVCVRHACLRDVEGERNAVEKNPFSCPFKFALQAIESGSLEYRGTLEQFDHSQLEASGGWDRVLEALDVTIPKWLSSQTHQTLRQQIKERREDAYIERLWLEDLDSAVSA